MIIMMHPQLPWGRLTGVAASGQGQVKNKNIKMNAATSVH